MATGTGQVLYEVNLEVDTEIVEAFDAWLQEHVQEMLQLPGFVSASILRDEPSESGPGASVGRTCQYFLQDRPALDTYLEKHATRMRQAGIDRFGDRFRASRRILQAGDTLASVASPEACQNCGGDLDGQYCAGCGQRARVRVITMWELTRDLVGDVFELDSRLWRSIRPLLFHPGYLTEEYLRGRRVRYIPPFRMYLVLSLLFFFVAALDQRGVEINGGDTVAGQFAPLLKFR